MTLLKREEKMAMVRLGAVLEKLHATASDPATPEDEAREASAELGMTILRHMDRIILNLKHTFD